MKRVNKCDSMSALLTTLDDLVEAPRKQPRAVHNSGEEWYTPREYIEAAWAVLGGIDVVPGLFDADPGLGGGGYAEAATAPAGWELRGVG